jgi:hypothetical protein
MVAVVPTPVTVVVVPAPMMAVPVMTPAHFLRLETIDFALVGDGRMGILIGGEPPIDAQRLRRQRRGLGGGGDRRGARNNPERDFQKIPAFHDIFPLPGWRVMRSNFRCAEMNAR